MTEILAYIKELLVKIEDYKFIKYICNFFFNYRNLLKNTYNDKLEQIKDFG